MPHCAQLRFLLTTQQHKNVRLYKIKKKSQLKIEIVKTLNFSKPLYIIPSLEPVILLFYTRITLPAAGRGATDESSLAECRAGSLEGQVGVVFSYP